MNKFSVLIGVASCSLAVEINGFGLDKLFAGMEAALAKSRSVNYGKDAGERIWVMDISNLNIGADEGCVLRYLNNFPGEFLTETEITRRADGKGHFMKDPHWAHNALSQLADLNLVEADGEGKYRLKTGQTRARGERKKFIDPKLRDILEHGNHKIDLSNFT